MYKCSYLFFIYDHFIPNFICLFVFLYFLKMSMLNKVGFL